jgi:spore protease
LNLPVIAIGIPTVVDSATMICDTLSNAGIVQLSEEISSGLDAIENFFVTPKETDSIIESAAMLLARALNEAFVIRG